MACGPQGVLLRWPHDVDRLSVLHPGRVHPARLSRRVPGSGDEARVRDRRVRRGADAPPRMGGVRGVEADRIRGLDSGADDYLVKPFSPNELLARVRAVLRRSDTARADDVIEYGGIAMDIGAHKVSRNDRNVPLGPTEFRLLRVLLERPGHVFSREQLLDRAWGRDIYLETRTVDVHILRLRKALARFGNDKLIQTVRGVGYRFSEAK